MHPSLRILFLNQAHFKLGVYWPYSYKLAEYTSWVQHPYIPYPGNGTFAFLGWPPKGPYPDPFDWEDCSNDCALYPICQMDL